MVHMRERERDPEDIRMKEKQVDVYKGVVLSMEVMAEEPVARWLGEAVLIFVSRLPAMVRPRTEGEAGPDSSSSADSSSLEGSVGLDKTSGAGRPMDADADVVDD